MKFINKKSSEHNLIKGDFNMEPLISIIMPSYNSEKYIREAIESVITQSYKNVELIIMDGGSTDNTINILKQYPFVKWLSEKDEGQSDALNKALELATGDIIGWLNSDDFYKKNTFEKVLSAFKENENTDVIYGNHIELFQETGVTRVRKAMKFDRKISIFYCYIPSTSFFVKRQFIDEGIRFNKSLYLTMDRDMFCQLSQAGKNFHYIDEDLAVFRWHEVNKSGNDDKTNKLRKKESVYIMERYFFKSTLNIPYSMKKNIHNMLYYIFLVKRNVLLRVK